MNLRKAARLGLVGVAAAACAMTAGAESAHAVVPTKPAQTWGVNGQVSAILPLPGGKVVVGGSFSAVVDSAGATAFPVTNVALFYLATRVFDSDGPPGEQLGQCPRHRWSARLPWGGLQQSVGRRPRQARRRLVDNRCPRQRWVGPGSMGRSTSCGSAATRSSSVGTGIRSRPGGFLPPGQGRKGELLDRGIRHGISPGRDPTSSDQPPSGRVWRC